MPTVVETVTLAEAAAQEEAKNEEIVDDAFEPQAPHSGQIAAYDAAVTYAKGAFVTEGTQVYRSQKAGNKGNDPKEDTDFVNWAPAGDQIILGTNPRYINPTTEGNKLRTQEEIVGVPVDPGASIQPYEAGKTYLLGEYSTEGGFGYQAIKANTKGETPSATPAAWKKLGPAIRLS